MNLLIYAVGFLLFLLITYQMVRRSQVIGWIVFLICPFLLLPFAIQQNSSSFVWIKVYSVCLGASWLLACRYTSLAKNKWALWLLWWGFAFNLIEAVVEALFSGDILNYVNSLAGILLFFTLPLPKEIQIDTSNDRRDLLWNTPMMWIIGYSIWNWTFLYITWPEFGLRHLVILSASLLLSLRNNKLWIQSRAFVLGIYLLIHFSYDSLLQPLNLPTVYYFPLALAMAGASLIWMTIYCITSRPRFLRYFSK